jgi:hypothetical protein
VSIGAVSAQCGPIIPGPISTPQAVAVQRDAYRQSGSANSLARTRSDRAHHIEQFMVCALGDSSGLHGRGTVKCAREQMKFAANARVKESVR